MQVKKITVAQIHNSWPELKASTGCKSKLEFIKRVLLGDIETSEGAELVYEGPYLMPRK